MRHGSLLFLALIVGTVAQAQEPFWPPETDMLARFSYQSSPVQTNGPRQICMSVSQDGDYRMVSSAKTGVDGPILWEGKMSQGQLLTLKRLLTTPAFRSLSGNDAGIIRNHAESFVAEISRVEIRATFQLEGENASVRPRSLPGPPRRLQWLNADDEHPFPRPLAKIVDWMTNFQPKHAKPLDYSEFTRVCPSVGLKFVQPSIASNGHP